MSTVNVRNQMPILVMYLVVQDLDHVTHGDDSHELSAAQYGYFGDVAIGHFAHDCIDFILETASHGVLRHRLGEVEPAKTLSPVMDEAEYVALAEDADQPTAMIYDRQRTDVVLDKLGDGLAHGRLAIDGDYAASFRLQDISNQHGTSPRYGARELIQRVEIRPGDALDLRFGNETRGYPDILSPFVQNFFLKPPGARQMMCRA